SWRSNHGGPADMADTADRVSGGDTVLGPGRAGKVRRCRSSHGRDGTRHAGGQTSLRVHNTNHNRSCNMPEAHRHSPVQAAGAAAVPERLVPPTRPTSPTRKQHSRLNLPSRINFGLRPW